MFPCTRVSADDGAGKYLEDQPSKEGRMAEPDPMMKGTLGVNDSAPPND